MGELEKLEWEWPWSCYPVCCVPICTIRFWCFDVCFPCSSFLLTVSVRPMLSFSRRMVHVTCDWCHLHYNFSFIWEKTYNLSGNCFIPGCSGKEKENTIAQLQTSCRWALKHQEEERLKWKTRANEGCTCTLQQSWTGNESKAVPAMARMSLVFPAAAWMFIRDSGTEAISTSMVR